MLHPYGWIESMDIFDAPVFKPNQRITFANLNVIVGDNGVGKTTLCGWLWALKNSSTLWRWGAYPPKPGSRYRDVRVAIDFRAPARHHLILEIVAGRTAFTLDDWKCPFNPVGYEVTALWSKRWSGASSEGDHVAIAEYLGMDEIEVQALADHINESPGVFLKGTEWRDVDIDESGTLVRYLYCKLRRGPSIPFRSLSGGETGAVLVDLAITRAKLLAVHRPTLLIIETSGLSMSEEFLSLTLDELSSPDVPFQSIVVTTSFENQLGPVIN